MHRARFPKRNGPGDVGPAQAVVPDTRPTVLGARDHGDDSSTTGSIPSSPQSVFKPLYWLEIEQDAEKDNSRR